MTAAPSTNGHRQAIAPDRRAAAVEAYRASLAAGEPLSGAELGRRFDRSPQWGRQVVADARATGRHGGRQPDEAGAIAPPADRHWGDTLIVLVVALVAAAVSFRHMEHVALMAGEPAWLARAFPITVDGLALAALRRGADGRRWLVLALAVSVAANVGAQFPDHAAAGGPLVSAWPPLALYGTHRLLHRS